MRYVGTVLIVLGAAAFWLIAYKGMTPDAALVDVQAFLQIPKQPAKGSTLAAGELSKAANG